MLQPQLRALTDRTVERRSARLHDPLDLARTAAPPTALAGAIVDAESRRVVVVGLSRDRALQHGLDCGGKSSCCRLRRAVSRRDRGGAQAWRQPREMQRFTRVDVAEASD